METDVEYYNITYPPLEGDEVAIYENDGAEEDEIRRSEINPTIQNSEIVSSNNPAQHTSARQNESNPSTTRPKSLYDEDNYALPSSSEVKSSPNSSDRSKLVSPKKSFVRKFLELKYSKFCLTLFGILFITIVTAMAILYVVKITEEDKGIEN